MFKSNQSASSFSRFIKSSTLKMLLAPLSAIALLGAGGTFWLPGEVNAQTTNRPAQTNRSNIARLNLTLTVGANESYDNLIARADATARNAAMRSFNQNRSLGAVAVTVSGQNAGSIAPLLSLQVNRQSWANSPNTRRWATYFKNAPVLLGLNTLNNNFANQPVNSNGVTTPGQVNGNVGVNGQTPVNGNNLNGTNGNVGVNGQTPVNGNNLNGTNGNVGVNGQTPVNGNNLNGTTVNNVPANNGQGFNGNTVNNVPTTSGQGSNVPTTSGQGSNAPTTSGQGFNGTNFNNVPTTSGQGYSNNLNNTNTTTNGTGFGNTGGTSGTNAGSTSGF